MSRKQEKYSVLLDTSFFCRLLSKSDPLHENAKGYFRYFLDNGIDMMDHFSFHTNLAYTYPHWLYDVCTYLIYNIL